jgi:fission process protein 1
MVNDKTEKEAATSSIEENNYDIFRDSPLRYLGYANEIGESFRYQFPKFVTPSYVVAFGYCFADAATSGHATFDEASRKGSPTAVVDALVSTTDTLIWQSLASVAIPGAIINTIVRASRFALSRSPMVLPAMVSTWLPTAVGLGSVPLIIHPIDGGVDFLMDSTFRQMDWNNMTTPSSKDESLDISRREQLEERTN